MNNWHSVWNSRSVSGVIEDGNFEQTFRFLTDCLEVSSVSAVPTSLYLSQFEANLLKMKRLGSSEPHSYYDVGCGSGAYLYYLAHRYEGLTLGGCDFSVPLLGIARKVLKQPFIHADVSDLRCTGAIEIDPSEKYDCVYSRSVFQYFPDAEYGFAVCSKMLEKATMCVALFDVLDVRKKEEFLAFRKSAIDDYERKYAQTPHLFYAKEDFMQIAERYGCKVLFARDPTPGYWNEPFVFDVYFYKP